MSSAANQETSEDPSRLVAEVEVAPEEEGYVKTAAYNYVSRKAFIHGAKNVEMKGKSIVHPKVHIRGDFQTVRIGRYCHIGEGSILRPPSYQASLDTSHEGGARENGENSNEEEKQLIKFLPLIVGSHTRIGKGCVIEAAAVGSSVYIGDNCVISKRVIIKDCCYIASGTVIAQDTVIPPFSRVAGCPGVMIEDGLMAESVTTTSVDGCVEQFNEFVKTMIQ